MVPMAELMVSMAELRVLASLLGDMGVWVSERGKCYYRILIQCTEVVGKVGRISGYRE